MGKITDNKLTVIGESGKEYKFTIYELDTKFKAVGGVYIFTERYNDGAKFRHNRIYCGKTKNLSERFDDHHKANCIKKNGANCICVMGEGSESKRTSIETDILKGNNFTCNEVLN